ncbi:Luc7p NDAI_0B03110 [Naumovozyma dairenensis CBS 421]|uniref:Uncharacterized protein n=1 Tax=Naumovozyma dairenensis (strain ATCC 10597 / BCRC 20456 / CBS 421 / NBRC 0211 / NRRL Y-12639) TaxID=1071378 RepID=G0W6D5_NAUDC|nr:hypothetical protein NDAI_0B03110 [Naumovozyma dairenensis CBS 421]CCD23346.1 hypothetical protein NDAI_0B03110 [Naumovozyma dairenensis CBS 421]
MSKILSTPAAEQRRLLEQLMGRDSSSSRHRGGSRFHSHSNRANDMGLYDPKICKSYLVGDCPYDLFQGTKQSLGRCPQIHLAKHKLKYEDEKGKGVKFEAFEREYFMVLSKFINDCNAQINIALKNLEHTSEEKETIRKATEELDFLDTRIGLMVQEIQLLVDVNEVMKALIQSTKLQDVQEKRKLVGKKVKAITENVGQSAQQKLQVCEVCGAYLSRLDTDRRLADHFLGKIHLGYVKMREHYEYYKKKRYQKT